MGFANKYVRKASLGRETQTPRCLSSPSETPRRCPYHLRSVRLLLNEELHAWNAWDFTNVISLTFLRVCDAQERAVYSSPKTFLIDA